MKKNIKLKTNKCNWKFSFCKNERNYLQCEKCGRTKREDLPDTRPCSGIEIKDRSMIQRILVQHEELKEYIES